MIEIRRQTQTPNESDNSLSNDGVYII